MESHLKSPEIGASVGVVHGHAVVAQPKHYCQQQPRQRVGRRREPGPLRRRQQRRASRRREVGAARHGGAGGEEPGVVEEQASRLKARVAHVASPRQLGALDGPAEGGHPGEHVGQPLRSAVKRGCYQSDTASWERHQLGRFSRLAHLERPGRASEAEKWEVEEVLVADHPSPNCGAAQLGLSLPEHLAAPSQERHRVDVRIAVGGVGGRLDEVGHGVVGIVLVYPPRDGEALRHVAPEDAEEMA